MSQPKLSVCIPTYNRSVFLRHTIGRFVNEWKFPFSYEIVVSDNASSDDTPQVVEELQLRGLPIIYVRQPTTVSSFENQSSAMRRGRGEYVIYLADDDILIDDEIVSTIEFLDMCPSVVACYSPVQNYDDREKKPLGLSFTTPHDVVAKKGKFISFFDFLIRNTIRPEIAVIRSSALSHMLVPRRFCNSAYSDLVHLLNLGDVAFRSRPFYRLVFCSPLVDGVLHAGTNEAKFGWNTERGGLEDLFVNMVSQQGIQLQPEHWRQVGQMLDLSEAGRMVVAMRLWMKEREYVAAYDLYSRVRLTLQRYDLPEFDFLDLAELKTILRGRVELRSIVELARALSLKKVLFAGGAVEWAGLLREVGLPEKVEISTVAAVSAVTDVDLWTMVLVSTAAEKDAMVVAGKVAGLVMDFETLHYRYAIPE